tara:strand:- start:116 stop:808 length:693 start_codon:yes stop_codon:yes gene_type:complete
MNNYLNRFEKKFFLDSRQESELKKKIRDIFFLDKFISNNHGYFCLSVYFDCLDMSSMNAKIEGLAKKTKIRVRTYLNNLDDVPKKWNFEIKNKDYNSVSKKKFSINHAELTNMFLLRNYRELLNKNFETIDKIYKPTYVVCYFREAYNSDIFSHCRITIDKDIICNKFSVNFMTELKQNKNFVIDPRKKLLELKYSRFLPESLSDVFQSLNLSQVTFSKYVDGILNQKYF